MQSYKEFIIAHTAFVLLISQKVVKHGILTAPLTYLNTLTILMTSSKECHYKKSVTYYLFYILQIFL